MRKWCKWPIALLLMSEASVNATELPPVSLSAVNNLQIDGHKAETACMPLLLEFSASACEYCDLLEEEILKPMLRNRDYDKRVLMRRIMVDSESTLTGFNGKPVTTGKLTYRYKVFVTPTLVFLDSEGNELAERMVGVNTLEMYGGYLDQALDASTQKLLESNRCY